MLLYFLDLRSTHLPSAGFFWTPLHFLELHIGFLVLRAIVSRCREIIPCLPPFHSVSMPSWPDSSAPVSTYLTSALIASPPSRIVTFITTIEPLVTLSTLLPPLLSTPASTAAVPPWQSTTGVSHRASTVSPTLSPFPPPEWPDPGPAAVPMGKDSSMSSSYLPTRSITLLSTLSRLARRITGVAVWESTAVVAWGTSTGSWRIASHAVFASKKYSMSATSAWAPGSDIGSAISVLAATASSFVSNLAAE
ncbi:hypothetical protein C8F01DRAFT_1374176 [Mycena amicta]|nr:hypothetical protein C8F01DRAFT_1375303 [Mycena amicta]KAJ7054960.1 hypothetical protein C8F01DRAFT_1374176 [Mycena amicta]